MNKLCGYCRAVGHTAARCDMKSGQILALRRHVYNERLGVVNLMLRYGLGAGAMVQCRDWWSGDDMLCMVVDPNESIDGRYLAPYASRNVKYQKQVRLTLHSVYRERPQWLYGLFLTDYNPQNRIEVICRPISNPSRSVPASFRLDDLGVYPRNPTEYIPSWERRSSVVAPSGDGQVDMTSVMRPFELPRRLGGHAVTPLAP